MKIEKTDHLRVRCTAAEKKRWEAAAGRMRRRTGFPVADLSQWVRWSLNTAANNEEKRKARKLR